MFRWFKTNIPPIQKGGAHLLLLRDYRLCLSLSSLSSFCLKWKEASFLSIRANPAFVFFIALFLLEFCSSGIFPISLASSTPHSSSDPSTLHKHVYLSTMIQKQNKQNKPGKLPVNLLLLQPSTQDLTSLYSALSRVPFLLIEVPV